MTWWWSWLLTGVGVTALWLAGSKKRLGWAIGLSGQALWLTYALVTEQYGFVFGALAYGSVYARNFLRWRADEKERGNG